MDRLALLVLVCLSVPVVSKFVKRNADGSCDIDGTNVPNGANHNVSCTQYHCQDGAKTIVSTGCRHNNTCYPLGHNMKINCMFHTCKQSGNNVKFYVDAGETVKCPHENQCLAVNQTFDVGCTKYKCHFDGVSEISFPVVERKCPHNGSCLALGATTDYYCSVLKCNNVSGTFKTEMHVPRCYISGKCRDAGTTVGCARCTADADNNPSIQQECSFKGSCIPVNGEHQDGCHIYKCSFNSTHYNMERVRSKCSQDGVTCFEEGDDIGECIKCGADGNIIYSCSHEGSCYDDGRSATIDCLLKTCNVSRNGSVITRGFVTNTHQPAKCHDQGVCYSPGDAMPGLTCKFCGDDGTPEYRCPADGECFRSGQTRTLNCLLHTCVVNGTGYGFVENSNQPTKCYLDGNCYSPGEAMPSGSCHVCKDDGEREYRCSHNGSCYAEGQTETIDCLLKTCNVSQTGNTTTVYFKSNTVQPPRCMAGGQCYSPGDALPGTCRFCKADGTTEYRCIHNGTCYAVGAVQLINCLSHTCTATTTIQFVQDTHQAAKCYRDGNCYLPGDKLPGSCKYCKHDGSTEYRCSHNNVCYAEGQSTPINCLDYICEVTIDGGYISRGMVPAPTQPPKCIFGNVCYSVGDAIAGTECAFCAADGSAEYRCPHEGACYSAGDIEMIDCANRTCVVIHQENFITRGFQIIPNQPTRCSRQGQCYSPGEQMQGSCVFCADNGVAEYRCPYGGNCYANQSSAVINCLDHICSVTIDGNNVQKEFDISEVQTPRCRSPYTGQCFSPGPMDTCQTCNQDGTITKGCSYSGVCYKAGDAVPAGSCTLCKDGGSYEYRCSKHGQCFANGDTYVDSCVEKKCIVTVGQTSISFQFEKVEGQTPQCEMNTATNSKSCVAHGDWGIHAISGADYNCTCAVSGNSYSMQGCKSL